MIRTALLRRIFAFSPTLLLAAVAWAVSVAPPRYVRPVDDERVYLEHADEMYFDQFAHPDVQRLAGKVAFRHGGMRLYCDSANYFEQSQSFEAFGHVRMVQGDTLTLTGEYLFYDGESQLAQVRRNVVMTHRQQVLKTDSLDYDRLYSMGYFFDGGELVDGDSRLTSDWGEYYTSTRRSTFNYNVELKNPKYTLRSDTLHYDTESKWAEVCGPSNIFSGQNTTIYTEHGFFNTQTERMRLYDRSVLRDATREMTGDSLSYDKLSGDMLAYGNIFYRDFHNKNILTGHFCRYNEQTGAAMATDSALVKDYSNPEDTLVMHADTFRVYTYNIDTDSVYRVTHAYPHVRAYRSDVQAVCDSLVHHSDLRRLTLYRDPIVWSEQRQILGEEINIFLNDSTVDSVYVERQALLVEQVDSTHFNQITGNVMRSYYEGGEMRESQVEGNVYTVHFPLESDSLVLYQVYMETAKARMFMAERKMQRIWSPASTGYFYAAGLAPAEHTWLENYAWFDYIRPLSRDDVFVWRGKPVESVLKPSIRREAPLQKLQPVSAAP